MFVEEQTKDNIIQTLYVHLINSIEFTLTTAIAIKHEFDHFSTFQFCSF